MLRPNPIRDRARCVDSFHRTDRRRADGFTDAALKSTRKSHEINSLKCYKKMRRGTDQSFVDGCLAPARVQDPKAAFNQ